MYNLSCLLDHRSLIYSYRYSRSSESSYIRSLAYRICEESHRNTLLVLSLIVFAVRKTSELDLLFHSRIPLKPLNSNKIHIIERELTQFRNLRLNENCNLLRIKSCRKVIQSHLYDILTYLFRIICIVCQSLSISNHDDRRRP